MGDGCNAGFRVTNCNPSITWSKELADKESAGTKIQGNCKSIGTNFTGPRIAVVAVFARNFGLLRTPRGYES